MERIAEPAARSQRLIYLGAVALTAVPAALAFGRVFSATAPAWQLAALALASALVASALERRNLLLAAAISAVVLVAILGVVVAPGSTRLGIPTERTLRAIWAAIGQVGMQARTEVAPTATLAPLMLAAVAAVWTATFAAHALAVRASSPLLAAIPLLAMFAFADLVLKKAAPPPATTLLLLGMIALLFADGLRRIRHWGPVRPWPGRAGRGRRQGLSNAPAVRGARRIAAASVAAALVVPLFLPGNPAGTGFDFGSKEAAGVIDPFVSIQANLTQNPPVELFDVISERPSYWRLMSLDRFDGSTWSTSDPYASSGQPIFAGPSVTLNTMAPDAVAESPLLTQEVHILALQTPWLPMAFSPRTLRLDEGSARYEPELGFASSPVSLSPGFQYQVDSSLVEPSAEQLDAAPDPSTPSDLLTPELVEVYTQLPPSVPAEIATIAHRLTDGEPNAYRKLIAIQNYFRSNFDYDENLESPGGEDALLYFLTKSRRGFCQQFSSAMTVMARELGYPSRVAVGFQAGFLDTSGSSYTVMSSQAHAWTEVMFPGYGWVAFEPTPGRNNPIAAGYGNPPPYQEPACKKCKPGEVAANGARDSSLSNNPPGAGRQRNALDLPFGANASPVRSLASRVALAGLALALALAVIVPPAKIAWRRVRRRIHGRTSRDAVLAVFRDFEAEAGDVGRGRAPGETPFEYAGRLKTLVMFSDGHLDRLTTATVRAAYAASSPDSSDVTGAAKDARLAIRDLRKATPPAGRIAAMYRVGRTGARSRSWSPGPPPTALG